MPVSIKQQKNNLKAKQKFSFLLTCSAELVPQ